jgi:hypothetical protein
MPRLFLLFTFLVLGISFDRPQAQAAFVVGGGGLMTNAYAQTIQDWLGNEEIQLTNIYTKKLGDSASHFHSAVDGMGRTITLIELLDTQPATASSSTWRGEKTISLSKQVVGGYNPKSFKSDGSYQWWTGSSDRAFLFNLASNELFLPMNTFSGDIETINSPNSGPTFGLGHDIYISGQLDLGGFKGVSYGPNPLAGSGQSIVMTNDPDEASIYQVSGVVIGSIEVYSISSIAAVPEPATMVLWGLGAIGLGAVQKKMRRRVSRDQSRREPSH